MTSGVPQGTVLGPILILYIKYTVQLFFFADDIILYKEIMSESGIYYCYYLNIRLQNCQSVVSAKR